ncbi:MAG: hypothetical protein E7310_01540 [Clostridiales bacterium]|nr:hypothetical protein [Clostridiales bacterium]
MKKSCKFLILIVIMFMLSFIVTKNVNADVARVNDDYYKVENTVDDFIFYLDIGSSSIYNVIDSTNTELYQGIVEYLYKYIDIEYDVKKIEKISDNTYKVKGKIEASGENWTANGFTVSFEVEKEYGAYKITYTDLFDKIGAENVTKTVFMIVGTIFLILGFGFILFIGIVTMIVVIIVVVNKKKKKEENKQ